MNKKIYVFIDSNNLYQGVKQNIPKQHYKGWILDYKKLYVYLINKYKATKIFIFIGYLEKYEKMYEKLQNIGYTLIFKPTIKYINKNKREDIKGNVDAELVLHSMIEYPNYDKAIIIAGDGDYKCLIEYLEKNGKLEKIVIPNQKSYSSLLIPFRKYMIFMNPLRNKLGE
jgi:uncharacterized LabA/DUF88 family protein